ncbi:MAG: uroporphyrinogen decarboxylase family protein [Candidatus Latescibacterota bacterium]
MTLTSRQRIVRILRHQEVDRIGLFEVFWPETVQGWCDAGHFARPEDVEDHFGLDLRRSSGTGGAGRPLNLVADVDTGEEVVEETADWRLVRDGNGAVLRWPRGSGAPEHVDFLVRDRQSWERHVEPLLLDRRQHERRVDFGLYRRIRAHCARHERYLTCAVVGAFDLMTPLCGHEHLLVGMAQDPAWVRRMAEVYAALTVDLLSLLFAREGLPDGLWVWDDLGFANGPFMSPALYRDLLLPAHQRLFAFAHERGLPVVLHADGCVAPLLPHLVEAGIDCLQPLEAKAGMDLVRIKREWGARLALIGGMDARVLVTNDREAVPAELEAKVPHAMAGSGYVLQVDHSVPPQVEYGTYRHFVEHGLRLGTYG